MTFTHVATLRNVVIDALRLVKPLPNQGVQFVPPSETLGIGAFLSSRDPGYEHSAATSQSGRGHLQHRGTGSAVRFSPEMSTVPRVPEVTSPHRIQEAVAHGLGPRLPVPSIGDSRRCGQYTFCSRYGSDLGSMSSTPSAFVALGREAAEIAIEDRPNRVRSTTGCAATRPHVLRLQNCRVSGPAYRSWEQRAESGLAPTADASSEFGYKTVHQPRNPKRDRSIANRPNAILLPLTTK